MMIASPYHELILAGKMVVAECKDILEVVVVFDGGSCTQACWCRSGVSCCRHPPQGKKVEREVVVVAVGKEKMRKKL
ncbi:hypothetical protein PanWU01x14_052730 [Parasponia andersonii]|uniref:Uncharacterized protein n=1 Tax=Parasponia andersonii TaxID=3476 RepID=A0A2P5DLA6_PARAD|nr:hypothetical protein PanWU01x14_052730 [Parasponia andersonii]